MDQLVRSHERLREQLAALVALGNAADVDLDVLDGLVAWFEGPGARHEADEEESLFPRLRGAALDDGTRALLDRLADEHRVHTELHVELASTRTVTGVARIAVKMERAYRTHLDLEERDLFPKARSLLGVPDFEAISAEMEARRGRAGSKP